MKGLDSHNALKALAAGSLRFFGQYVTPAWDWSPRHWRMIAQKLQAVERGDIKRLMIFTPPRHGKSELSTIHFPAWFLLKNPDKRVIATSYSADLAKTFSRRVRAIVREYGKELFGVELSDESASVDQWSLKGHHGMFLAAGVGGPITGQGASLFLIDDPIKNAEEANSPTYRQRVWDWWTSTAYTRLEPNGAVVLTLTRWHEDDLAGRLLQDMEAGGETWEVLRLPAIAEDVNDPLERENGEPLWPDRYGHTEYERIQKAVGTYVWNALYQQRPQSLEGGAFKASWFRWYTKNQVHYDDETEQWFFLDEPMTIFQGVDPAISLRTAADEFVLCTIGVTPTNKILILDVYHDHLEFTDQSKLVISKFQEWGATRVGIEINAYQAALATTVAKDAMIPVKRIHHKGDKYTRIMTMAPYFENAQVHMRAALETEPGWIDQTRLPGIKIHERFKHVYEQLITYGPTSAHDDVPDAIEVAISVAKVKTNPNEFYTMDY